MGTAAEKDRRSAYRAAVRFAGNEVLMSKYFGDVWKWPEWTNSMRDKFIDEFWGCFQDGYLVGLRAGRRQARTKRKRSV